jgi:hypothetical protein
MVPRGKTASTARKEHVMTERDTGTLSDDEILTTGAAGEMPSGDDDSTDSDTGDDADDMDADSDDTDA